jgi:hypothetical protein
MKSTIAKIFLGQSDGDVHAEFVKFSRGVFENRYLLEGKKQKDKWQIKTSNEFANFFVKTLADKLGVNSAKMKGIIVSTRNLKEVEGFDKILAQASVKQFMGVKQFQIDQELTGNEIKRLIAASPTSFFALTFNVGGDELKIKAKAPKSAKPGTKTKDDGGPKADFCSLKTPDGNIVKDLFFDFLNFSAIKIRHTIEIKEIELPKEYKTPEEMRGKAVRKGIVKRIVEIDGKKEVREAKLEA